MVCSLLMRNSILMRLTFSRIHWSSRNSCVCFIVLFRHLLVIFCRLYGFPSWKLSWPHNESVKTRPVRILSVRKISLIVSVMCTRWNCLTREEYSLLFCIKILRLLIVSKSRATFLVACVFPALQDCYVSYDWLLMFSVPCDWSI